MRRKMIILTCILLGFVSSIECKNVFSEKVDHHNLSTHVVVVANDLYTSSVK